MLRSFVTLAVLLVACGSPPDGGFGASTGPALGGFPSESGGVTGASGGSSGAGGEGCGSDLDCKGTRICSSGRCQDAPGGGGAASGGVGTGSGGTAGLGDPGAGGAPSGGSGGAQASGGAAGAGGAACVKLSQAAACPAGSCGYVSDGCSGRYYCGGCENPWDSCTSVFDGVSSECAMNTCCSRCIALAPPGDGQCGRNGAPPTAISCPISTLSGKAFVPGAGTPNAGACVNVTDLPNNQLEWCCP